MGETMSIKIMGLEHALVSTDDFDSTRKFYGNVLGLEPIPPFDSEHVYEHASFECAGNQIHIVRGDPSLDTHMTTDPAVSFNPSMQPHIAFRVESIAACRDALDSAGYPYYAVREEGVIGRSQVFVRDPAGFVVELFEVLSVPDA
jgi:catechol 2,3-dioxygenase-like lactoylglutathione lyase family enzyme